MTTIKETTVSKPDGPLGLAFAAGFFFSGRAITVLVSTSVLGLEPSTGAALNLVLGLLLLGLICLDSLGSGNRRTGPAPQLSGIRWILLFLAFSLASLMWSETASLPDSAAYWCGLAADVATLVLIFRGGTTTRLAHSLMKGFIASACCLALVAWIMPTQADLRLGDEQLFNTNQIGNLCAMGILFAQYLSRRNDGRWRFATLFLVVTLFRSLSKTTIAAFLICEGFLLIQDKSISKKKKAGIAVGTVLLIFVFWGLFEAYYNVYTTTGNQAENLTGRTAIWIYVLNAVPDHPWNLWIGHGFDSWWKVVPPFSGGKFEARHAENDILQQFYAYGVAGVVMLAGLYGSLFLKLRKLPRGPIKLLLLGILLFTVIRGLAEAEPFDLLLPLWAIVLIGVLADCESGPGKNMAVAPALSAGRSFVPAETPHTL